MTSQDNQEKANLAETLPEPDINQRSAARLAAIQALYQMDLVGTDLNTVLPEFEKYRLGQIIEDDEYAKADAGFFKHLVKGVVEHQKEIDPEIHDALADGWPLHRLDITLRAILRCGTFEIYFKKDTAIAVIVNEYLELTHAFFEDVERKLVHAVLDHLAKKRDEHAAPTDEDKP